MNTSQKPVEGPVDNSHAGLWKLWHGVLAALLDELATAPKLRASMLLVMVAFLKMNNVKVDPRKRQSVAEGLSKLSAAIGEGFPYK